MDTMSAWLLGMANRGREQRVFDWEKAAKIIAERKPLYAIAGLRGDMGYTAGYIYADGEIDNDDYTYLASTWATPVLVLGEADYNAEEIECYRMQSETPGWDEHTKWPKEALRILEK